MYDFAGSVVDGGPLTLRAWEPLPYADIAHKD